MKKTDHALSQRETQRKSVPAYTILSGIADVVPASRWIFARVGAKDELTAVFDSQPDETGLSNLIDELRRQRAKAPTGPRIAATLGGLQGFTCGVTLVFANARSTFGILTLLRSAELGPFTSSEISMLTFALAAVTDFLSALRVAQPADSMLDGVFDNDVIDDRREGAFYVLDRDLAIVLALTSEDERRLALTGLPTRIAERLPTLIEQTVRELAAAWSTTAPKPTGLARPVSFLVVHAQPMSGPSGLFIGVHIDRFQPPNSLTGAASRYHISPRELQVLALILDGNHLEQIATHLAITSSTVQDHIRSMLEKTDSGNRSELIARVLGWESPPRAQRA